MAYDEDDEPELDEDPAMQGLFEREMEDSLGPPLCTDEDEDDWRYDDGDDDDQD